MAADRRKNLSWTYLIFLSASYLNSKLSSGSDVFVSTESGILSARTSGRMNPSKFNLDTNDGESFTVGLAVDIQASLIFWSDESDDENKKGIWKATYLATSLSRKTRIVHYNGINVYGLAVDWIYKHVYWTDSNVGVVRMSNYDGQFMVNVVSKRLLNPRGLSVNPIDRSLYVGDQGTHLVMKCSLDGSNCQSRDLPLITWPNQITIDYARSRVLVVDGWTTDLLNCSPDLSNCTKNYFSTFNKENTIFGVTITAENTLVSTFKNLTLYPSDDGDSNNSLVFSTDNKKAFYIVAKDRQTQPDDQSSNPCKTNNGNCPEMCVPLVNNDYTCTCSSDKVLVQNQCRGDSEVLLYLDRTKAVIGMVSPENLLKPGRTIIASSRSPEAMTFVPNEKMIYFSDVEDSAIYRVRLGENQHTTFLSRKEGINVVTGLAYDTLQQRVYFINKFNKDDGSLISNCVEMTNLRKTERRRLTCSNNTYTSLYIDQRYLFFTTVSEISRVTLDGLGKVRKHIFSSQVENFAFVSVRGQQLLYSVIRPSIHTLRTLDFSARAVTRSSITDETQRYLVLTKNSKENTLYVGDPVGNKIIQLEIDVANTVSSSKNIATDFEPHQLLFINKAAVPIPDNGRCDDDLCGAGTVCFQKPDITAVSCLCPSYRFNVLDDSRRICKAPEDYILFTGMEGLQMIPVKSTDTSVYTLVQGDNSDGFFGLASDDNDNVYFSQYEGRAIYTINMKDPTELNVLTVQRTHMIRNIVFSDGKLFWTGVYDSPSQNKFGGIFSMDVNSKIVTEVIGNITNPLEFQVNPSFIVWLDGNSFQTYRRTDATVASVTVQPGVTLQGLQQDEHGRLFYTVQGGDSFFELDTVKGSGVQVFNIQGGFPYQLDFHGLSIYISERPAGISLFDIRTRQRTLLRTNMVANKLIAFVTKEKINFEKPGKCGAVEVYRCAGNAQRIQCLTDYDCLQSNRSKCCGDFTCRVCTPAVKTQDTCEITLQDNSKMLLKKGDTFQRSDCKTCSCEDRTCSDVNCPVPSCKDDLEVVPGYCCGICTSISSCKRKPLFKNCPNNGEIEITLPSMEQVETLSRTASITVDRNHPKLRDVTAMSCSGQLLTWRFETTTFKWKKEPQDLKIIAEDNHGSAECLFKLVIKDATPPRFISFPQSAKASAKTADGARVVWSSPVVYDNSGSVVVTSDRQNGDVFPINFTPVTYTATDGSGNKITKTFSVKVDLIKDLKCQRPPEIANGYIECKKSSGGTRQTCAIKCQRGFRFNSGDFEQIHNCVEDGVYRPAFKDGVVSSCFKPQPTIVGIQMSQSFNCPNAIFTLTDVIDCLKIVKLCPDPSTSFEVCDLEHLNGETKTSSVTINATITGKLSYGTTMKNRNKLKRDLKDIADKIADLFKSGTFAYYCPNIGCKLSTISAVSDVPDKCEAGSVMHTIDGNQLCARCPGGTLYKKKKCHKCPVNHYQDLEGQFECKKCPSQRKYSKEGSWLLSACSAIQTQAIPKSDTTDSDSSSVSLLPIGIGVGVVVLVLLIIVAIIMRRRSKQSMNVNGESGDRMNVAFTADISGTYDVIPHEHESNDPYDIIGNVSDKDPALQDNGACAAESGKSDEEDPYTKIVKPKEEEAPYSSLAKDVQ